ncbi:MAG: hypothetical protein MUE42_03350 [Opitutaceae bacterium]|jgi:hypothetical protein|nr:hypothetical protein [Opitutaceae bacterium]
MPDRRILLTVGAVGAALLLWLALPFFSPARGVERSWDGLLSALEDNDLEAFGAYLGEDYADGFGLDRAEAVKLAGEVRRHFIVCTVRRERSELVLDPLKKSAVTRGLIRLGGQGSPVAQGAIEASRATDSPTAFRWRRNSWRPWDWRLVSIDNLEAAQAIARFRRQADQLGFTP